MYSIAKKTERATQVAIKTLNKHECEVETVPQLVSLLGARGYVNIPGEVADTSGVIFDDDAVYKRARFALREHKSRKRRVLCVIVVVVMSLDVVCVVVIVIVLAGGRQSIEHNASESQC